MALCRRLKVEYEEINCSATLNSVLFESQEHGVSDRIYDNSSAYLSDQQIRLLEYLGGERAATTILDRMIYALAKSPFGAMARSLSRRNAA
jgi:hypothetical protein